MQTRRYQVEWMLLLTMLLVLGALIGYWLYDERNRVEAREQDRLQVQARVIDENLRRQLEGANNALAGVRDEFPPPFSKSVAQAASRRLKTLSHSMPGVRTMLLADANGTVVAASRDEFIDLSASEREYFKVPREHPDPAMLYVSPPFRTTLGVFSINAVRAVHAGKRYLCGKAAGVLAEHVARRSGPNRLDDLSPREREILQLVAEGCSSAEIAGKLNLSPKTVDTYRSRLMHKLEIHDVAGLVKFSILHGLTTLE